MQKINIIEDYLESVLIIQKANGLVRSIDIANRLGVTKPTVCEMVRKLSDQNIILEKKRIIVLKNYINHPIS